MHYNRFMLESLEKEVSERLSPVRMAHTVRVREMVSLMCERLLIAESSEMEAAALLHDLAKEESFEKQLHLALESATISSKAEGERYGPVLHGYAALPLICRDFPSFASKDILNAVRYHTTGAPNMSVFAAIVFLADYIELGREQKSCVEARNLFFEKTSEGTQEKRERGLFESVFFALSKTKAYLESRSLPMHPDTERAFLYYQALFV